MALPTASDNPFPSILITEGTEPSAPAAGKQRVYIDSTSHHLSRTDSSAAEVDLESITEAKLSLADNTTADSSTSKHGFLKKLDNNSAHFMNGAGAWATPSGTGSTVTGNALYATPPGMSLVATGTSALVASTAYMGPVEVKAPMFVRNFTAWVSSAGSGTHQWGLFDFSASATAATKLAGGSGALNSTGEVSIAASGAPVSINAGSYVLIVLAPAANAATVRIITSTVATKMNQQSQGSYSWTDTPNIVSGWGGAGSTTRIWYLTGDVVSGTQF